MRGTRNVGKHGPPRHTCAEFSVKGGEEGRRHSAPRRGSYLCCAGMAGGSLCEHAGVRHCTLESPVWAGDISLIETALVQVCELAPEFQPGAPDPGQGRTGSWAAEWDELCTGVPMLDRSLADCPSVALLQSRAPWQVPGLSHLCSVSCAPPPASLNRCSWPARTLYL